MKGQFEFMMKTIIHERGSDGRPEGLNVANVALAYGILMFLLATETVLKRNVVA